MAGRERERGGESEGFDKKWKNKNEEEERKREGGSAGARKNGVILLVQNDVVLFS